MRTCLQHHRHPSHALQGVTAKQRGLGRRAAVLARDIAAVWTGLRGAVMVDYMQIKHASLDVILTNLMHAAPAGEFANVVSVHRVLHLQRGA